MQPITVIKIGGNVIDNEAALPVFLQRFANIPGNKILVHGGGKLATRLAETMNIPQQMVNGRRITDAASLQVVTMVYAGDINKKIVAGLQSASCNAIGLTGADGNLIEAKKREAKEIDYGFVGDLTAGSINTTFLLQLFEAGLTPVIAPITHNKSGQLLNTNADTIASALAVALAAQSPVTLIFCFEKKGVLRNPGDEDSVVTSINPQSYAQLKDEGIITAGMIPKLDNAFAAIGKGVRKVVIGSAGELEELVQLKKGTVIGNE